MPKGVKKRPKHKPNGTISAEELCSVTGLSDSMHRKLAAAGYYPPPVEGKYQSFKTLSGLIRYQRETIRKKDDTLAKEKAGLTAARRQTVEKELAILNDEYLKKSVIGPPLRNAALHQRVTLQRKFEQEVCPKLGELTPLERLSVIKQAVDEVCAIFQEQIAGWIGERDDSEPCKAPLTS